jgi:uncharacterized protein (TIGR02145 family)
MAVSGRFTTLAAVVAVSAAVLISCGGKGAKGVVEVVTGTFTDSRDGKVYRTVSIGNRVWMAENLNYKGEGEETLGRCYVGKEEENCAKYGRLYPLYESEKLCPAGWRLPIDADWAALVETVGDSGKVGKKLKASTGWKDNGSGTDDYGFAALPGGYGSWDDNNFGEAGVKGYWYSATLGGVSDGVSYLTYWTMTFDEDYLYRRDEYGDGARFFSVRCVQESDDKEVKAALEADDKQAQLMVENHNRNMEEMEAEQLRQAEEDLRYEEAERARMAKESITTFTDSRDGKTYKQVTIGGQNWMAENLNYAAESSACYENKDNNCAKYGRLYIWDAAKQACPDGWHLSTDGEWTALEDEVGGRDIAGTKLKSTAGWNNKGNKADDYGFTALPGGYGDSNRGYFSGDGYDGYWWSATESNVGGAGAWSRLVNYSNEFVYRSNEGKARQFSVRCVQDQEQN